MTTVSRPKKGKFKHHAMRDGAPLCGARKNGEWQMEFPRHFEINCIRCLKAQAKVQVTAQ